MTTQPTEIKDKGTLSYSLIIFSFPSIKVIVFQSQSLESKFLVSDKDEGETILNDIE